MHMKCREREGKEEIGKRVEIEKETGRGVEHRCGVGGKRVGGHEICLVLDFSSYVTSKSTSTSAWCSGETTRNMVIKAFAYATGMSLLFCLN